MNCLHSALYFCIFIHVFIVMGSNLYCLSSFRRYLRNYWIGLHTWYDWYDLFWRICNNHGVWLDTLTSLLEKLVLIKRSVCWSNLPNCLLFFIRTWHDTVSYLIGPRTAKANLTQVYSSFRWKRNVSWMVWGFCGISVIGVSWFCLLVALLFSKPLAFHNFS